MSRKFNLATLVQTQFSEASREEMNKAYEIAKGHASPIIDDEALRVVLVELYKPDETGDIRTMQPPASRDSTPAQRAVGRIPNLRPTGKWEGRMRRVTLHKFSESSPEYAVTLGWEGVKWSPVMDIPVDMPWPYWQSLLNTDFIDDRSDVVTTWPIDPATGKISCVRTSRRIKTQRYEDHGDVSGTEDLPRDYSEFFQREAQRTNCFRNYSRSALMTIHNILIEPYGKTATGQAVVFDTAYFQHMTDLDLRIKIAAPLGPDIVSIMEQESFPIAEAG
jgi:hypothetical protein